jgi:hypothetical protein
MGHLVGLATATMMPSSLAARPIASLGVLRGEVFLRETMLLKIGVV